MGGAPRSFLDFSGNKQRCNSTSDPWWSKDPESQAKKRRKSTVRRAAQVLIIKSKRSRRMTMRRGAHVEGSRRTREGMEVKVRTLKKLVPNTESMGLDGLFRETADYILCLQMRVKVMQAVFNVLSSGSEE